MRNGRERGRRRGGKIEERDAGGRVRAPRSMNVVQGSHRVEPRHATPHFPSRSYPTRRSLQVYWLPPLQAPHPAATTWERERGRRDEKNSSYNGDRCDLRPWTRKVSNQLYELRGKSRFLTLSGRMPPYSRHHRYSTKIECRHTGGKKKKFQTFAEIETQKLPNFTKI